MSQKRSGFSKMLEDLTGVGGTGGAFRSAMSLLLMGCIGYGGWLIWQSWHVRPFIPRVDEIQTTVQDKSVDSLPDRFKMMWKIRSENDAKAKSIRATNVYAFNSLPPPEAKPDYEAIRRKEEEERRLAMIEARRMEEQAIYHSIQPDTFMFVKSVMTGKDGRKTAMISFTNDPFGLFPSTGGGLSSMGGVGGVGGLVGDSANIFPVYAGVKIPLPVMSADIIFSYVGDDFVTVKVKNGEWKLPVPRVERGENPIVYPVERRPVAKDARKVKIAKTNTQKSDQKKIVKAKKSPSGARIVKKSKSRSKPKKVTKEESPVVTKNPFLD